MFCDRMKLLIVASVFLSSLITETATISHWQKQHKLRSKAHYESKGCNCLNGGVCITYHLFSKLKRCSCPKGYSGDHCEIDSETRCYTGDGKDYRGTKSVDMNGEKCLSWDSPLLRRWKYNDGIENAMSLGLGKHNYCRNPNGESQPWCYVRKGFTTTPTPCDVPVCQKENTCGQRSYRKYFKIVGGQRAAIESQPWIATIFRSSPRGNSQFICGGSLIDPCWVLTAAHCFDNPIPHPSQLHVVLGKSELYVNSTKEQEFNVDRLIIHEGFSLQTVDYNNDIALLRIRSSSGQCAQESETVKTICLPSQNLEMRDNSQCEVSGYGRESKTAIYYSRILKSTNINMISQSMCQKYYADRKVTGNMFCAGDPLWKTDACKGDSGGPLVCEHDNRMVLYGIVSWGAGCSDREKPGVYTKVTKYLNWIESHMNAIHFKSYYPPK
uniref:Urokinase-type plasminogen activator n=1 Tax=Salvator merianae TaxID=96440 RepID=A0A8D0AYE1_SALMN